MKTDCILESECVSVCVEVLRPVSAVAARRYNSQIRGAIGTGTFVIINHLIQHTLATK